MTSLEVFHLVWLGLLPVQLIICTWIGTWLGAFASMRILVPLGFFGYWAEWTIRNSSGRQTLTVHDVQHGMSISLLSFFVLFSFTLPYFTLLKVLAPRLQNRLAAVITVLGATAAAVGLRYLYRPVMEVIFALPPPIEHATATAVAITLMFIQHKLFRRAPAEGPAPAQCRPRNWVARVLTLVGILALLESPYTGQSTVAWILYAVPRLTPELVAGTHAANGPKSAEAVLAGLPLGLAPYVVFCVAYPFLALGLDVWIAYWGAVALSLFSIVPLFADLLRRRTSPSPIPG